MKDKSLMVNLFWLLISIGGTQLIRLAGNLVLTRLLAPEMFGLMALVTAFILGASMFSDVGIRGSIINNKTPERPEFYNTAWSVQIIRGFVLYFGLLILSFPLSNFYDIENLPTIIAIAASTTIITGLTPTKVYSHVKELNLKRVSLLEIGAQLIGMACFIALAYEFRNIWSLVFGTVVTASLTTAFYYLFLNGNKNKWCWDWPSFYEIFRYGRWILLSTGSAYLISQGDRLVLGKFLTLEMLGIYSIAINFSMLFLELGENAAAKFLFPLYRKVVERGPAHYSEIRKYRLLGMLLGVAGCLPLLAGGQWLIEFLYDERYVEAGWMLQVLTLSSVFRLLDTTLRPIFLAHASSFDSMIYQMIKGGVYLFALIMGVAYYGILGLIVVLIVTPLLNLLLLHAMVRKYGYKWPLDDLPIIISTLFLAWGGWQLVETSPITLMMSSGF